MDGNIPVLHFKFKRVDAFYVESFFEKLKGVVFQPILRRSLLFEWEQHKYLDCWSGSQFLDVILDVILLFKKFLLYF